MFDGLGQNADAIRGALQRTEIGEVHQDLDPGGNEGVLLASFAKGPVHLAVDEVPDDADLLGDAKNLHRAGAQVVADGGNAVGLLDGELGDRKVGGFGADERDVGPVEGGDERQAAVRSDHLLRQKSRDGVRDGVVDVQQVQA